MNIGIFFDNSDYSNLDYSRPSQSNPGISGTGIQIAILMEQLEKFSSNFNVIRFSPVKSLIKSSKNIVIKSESTVTSYFKSESIDIYITTNCYDKKLIDDLKRAKTKIVFWAHNYLFYYQLELIKSLENNYRLVFCGRQF